MRTRVRVVRVGEVHTPAKTAVKDDSDLGQGTPASALRKN